MSSSTKTIGEALIACIALAGFFTLVYAGKANVSDLWALGAVLLVVAAFYAVLLLIRAVFTFMVGGDHFWWEKYEDEKKKHLWGKK